jgi:glycosyltransferase involved in cell wall biosynthesis
LDLLLYRRSDLLLAVSPVLAHELVECYGLPHDRICVAEPGRDLQLTPNATGDMRLGRRTAVLCVGNWFPNKGIIDLLEAVSVLPADDVTLHLVGRSDVDRRYAARVQARLSSADLANRVVVHGSVAPRELGGLYAGADVFALPSYSETYGTVYAEALTAGLPVIGWRSGNLPSLIEDHTEGCLLDPGDITGLSSALRRLATDDTWRATLARAARRRGKTLPTWTDTADRFFGAISRLRAARD